MPARKSKPKKKSQNRQPTVEDYDDPQDHPQDPSNFALLPKDPANFAHIPNEPKVNRKTPAQRNYDYKQASEERLRAYYYPQLDEVYKSIFDERRRAAEQLNGTRFHKYVDSLEYMEMMLAIDTAINEHGVAFIDEAKATPEMMEDLTGPICCKNAWTTKPKNEITAAKALELFFYEEIGHERPYKAIDPRREPDWYKNKDDIIFSIYEDTDLMDTEMRVMMLQKFDEKEKGYGFVDVLTDE